MIYIAITYIDASSGVVCTAAPMRVGPAYPQIKNLNVEWADQSTWPILTTAEGAHTRAPLFFGTCDDDADLSVPGVVATHTAEEYQALKTVEHLARKPPYPSWIGDLDTMTWVAPVPRPADAIMNGGNVRYQWDEATLNWIPQAEQ